MNLKFKKICFIILAFISLAIGFIGIILPILPTTPFLLLSSYLFAKGSNRLHDWFISTKIYKNHLEDFVKDKAMTLKSKLSILLPVSTMLIITFIFINNLHARIAIIIVMVFKYYYFFTFIETVKLEKSSKDVEYVTTKNKG